MKVLKNVFKIIALALLITSVQQSNLQAMGRVKKIKEFVTNHKKKLGAAATIMTVAIAYAATHGIADETVKTALDLFIEHVKFMKEEMIICGGLAAFALVIMFMDCLCPRPNEETTE